MNAVLRAAADLQSVFVARGWQFCFIGGLAVLRWGEPRETVDVDATLLTGVGSEDEYIDALLHVYDARVEDAAAFARTRRVLLLRSASGVGLDIALAGLPFEELAVARSSTFVFAADVSLTTCSAEDLIVLKAFAAREKDWVDVDGIIVRQAGSIDWTHVSTQLRPLVELKEEPEILEQLERRRRRLER